MNRNEALAIVQKQMTEKRFQHTIGVMHTAIELANRYGADPVKAEQAAIFHDYAKFRNKDEMKLIMLQQGMNPELLIHSSELWHAPVGAYLVQTEVGIDDLEVLDAIAFHTSGRINMSLLDRVIFLADYIEPGREFPGVAEVRELAEKDLDKAVIMALKNTMTFLLAKNQTIYPDTFHTYNDLIMKNKE